MTLESIFAHVQDAADELRDMLKEEQRQEEGEGKPTTYVFSYEQTGDKEYPGEWWPNYRYIDGHDIEEAFCRFGHTLKASDLMVRNICYGPEREMCWAMNRVSAYWEAERAKKRKTAP